MIDCKSMTHGTLSAIYIPFPSKGIPKLEGASEFAFPFKVPFHVELLKGVTNCEMSMLQYLIVLIAISVDGRRFVL